jgi:anti-anti-sigma factor
MRVIWLPGGDLVVPSTYGCSSPFLVVASMRRRTGSSSAMYAERPHPFLASPLTAGNMIDWKTQELGENKDILLFEMSGRLDVSACEYFYSVLEGRIRRGCKKLILDCENLDFISSMGLGMLMRVHSRMKKEGGDVKLARIHGAVAEVVKLVMLDRVLHMYPSVEAALESFKD